MVSYLPPTPSPPPLHRPPNVYFVIASAQSCPRPPTRKKSRGNIGAEKTEPDFLALGRLGEEPFSRIDIASIQMLK